MDWERQGFTTDGGQAVLAAVAVHAGLAAERLSVALENEVDEAVVDAEMGVGDGTGGPGLGADALDENTREEEIRNGGDPIGTQAPAPLDGRGHARVGE